ncbi:hypothetical protein SAMN05444858_12511 [Micromonospora avicenniae]|uniref:Uncharacterized protein n=1 Tax=Micromonospora avicenniae TaxID=1198245 RepID=A0A1N7EMA9_9ACTN|nr:hypothetical protein SAMN05444858_12511 [Micromonospora avicenniae]
MASGHLPDTVPACPQFCGSGRPGGAEERQPCLDKPQTLYVPDVTPEMVDTLQHEQARLSERIECLTRNRDAIADYLETVLKVRSGDDTPLLSPARCD